MLKLYNTETRLKEEITPLDGETIRMYACGPTIYDFAHIGNFRTYVFGDLLRRTLKYFGFKVEQVMNLTDVEDKTIKGSLAKGVSLSDFTKPYATAFFEDLKTLHIEPAESYPAATDYIPQMIAMIQRLLDSGIAYAGADGSIYYDISRFPSYGRLSHLPPDGLKTCASERVSADEYEKEHACDFVLWKGYEPARDGNVFWESPFGKGRPGWHIECSAMALGLLGETIDIHIGGVDLIFPHHENEIAQSEAFSGKRFVRHWLHCEHLLVDHRKMSKSLGNFHTLRDLLQKGYTGDEVRYLLLQTHYRTQLNFTFQGLDAARHSLERVADFILRLRSIQDHEKEGQHAAALLLKARKNFDASLADDLNISSSLAALFEMIRGINSLCDDQKVGKKEAGETLKLLHAFNTVLALLPLEEKELSIPEDLKEALLKREEARTKKDWKMADHFRDLILSRGYLIEDTPTGSRLKKS